MAAPWTSQLRLITIDSSDVFLLPFREIRSRAILESLELLFWKSSFIYE